MSLQNLAKQIQSQGRNSDTMLVHMTPGEVRGLQALAVAHGGSLTVNPETGLAEAGFLKSILPAVAGFALGPAGFGVMSSLGAGLTVGGLTAATSGDLGKGLMAGLGAYGGSELGALFSGAGGAATGAAANAAGQAGAAGQAAGAQAGIGAASEGAVGEAVARKAATEQAAKVAAEEVAKKSALSSMSPYLYASAPLLAGAMLEQPKTITPTPEEPSYIRGYTLDRQVNPQVYAQDSTGGERQYFRDVYTPMPIRQARAGGLMSLAVGGTAKTRISPDEFINQYLSPVKTVTQIPGGMSGYEGEYAPSNTGAVIAPGGVAGDYTGRGSEIMTDESGREYTVEFNPVTGEYTRVYIPTPEPTPTPAPAPEGPFRDSGGGFDSPTNSMSAPSGVNTGPSQAVTDAMAYAYNALGFTPGTQAPAPVVDMSTYSPSSGGGGYAGAAQTEAEAGMAPGASTPGSATFSGPTAPSGGGGGGGGGGVSPGGGNAAGGFGFGGWARGGLIGLAAGGLAQNSFIIPADVVSAMGNGSTKAGMAALNTQLQRRKAGGATLIQGAGDGLSDSIPTNIDGRQPALVADGEAYIDPVTVNRLGAGSAKKGSAKLYEMMNKIRKQAHGKTAQQRKVNPAKALG